MVMVGAVVSITMALFAESEPAAPGAGSVRDELTPPFRTVPPFKVRAFAEVYSNSALVSPAPTT